MSRRLSTILGMTAVLTLAACSSGTASSPGGATPVPTAAGSGPGGDAPCAPSTAAGSVQAGMADIAFQPSAIEAKVGDVIAWTNTDNVPHTATLKDVADCTTDNLAQGASGAIIFNAPGAYPFFCKVHPGTMSGTITVTG